MYYVGKISYDIYKPLTPNMTNNEVVISDTQIDHVMKRHPADYEAYLEYMAECVSDPDYVIASNKPNTAIVLKELEVEGKMVKVILRLQTTSDPVGYKNSIITFQHIEKKRYSRYVRNGKIIYQKYNNVI